MRFMAGRFSPVKHRRYGDSGTGHPHLAGKHFASTPGNAQFQFKDHSG